METKRISKKIWCGMLGFDPNIIMKQKIFEECERDKLTLQEVCGKYQMPEVFYTSSNDPNEPVEFQGERLTIKEIQKQFPFKRIVLINTRQ